MATLAEKLQTLGCTMESADFNDVVVEVWHALCPDWTDEELLVHPRDALRLCDCVRMRVDCNLPDELILRAMTNIRKKSARKQLA